MMSNTSEIHNFALFWRIPSLNILLRHRFFSTQVPEDMKEIDRTYDFKLDGFGRWDMPTDDYYDIEEFSEGYTGYDGSNVWNFIHKRICFQGYSYQDNNHWKADFNKAVSGMHAMVSAQIIRGIQERIDDGEDFTPDEKWTDPVAEFNRRISPQGEIPEAMDNLYFLYTLLLRAVIKSKDRFLDDQKAGLLDDMDSAALNGLYQTTLLSGMDSAVASQVNSAAQSLQEHAVKDQEALWEARMRTRELQRVMNCVQCNKCRLHGKIATMGVSTALQILLGWNGQGTDPRQVQRVEMAALLTALHKCARAVDLCVQMKN